MLTRSSCSALNHRRKMKENEIVEKISKRSGSRFLISDDKCILLRSRNCLDCVAFNSCLREMPTAARSAATSPRQRERRRFLCSIVRIRIGHAECFFPLRPHALLCPLAACASAVEVNEIPPHHAISRGANGNYVNANERR